jgi:hypothetical protein
MLHDNYNYIHYSRIFKRRLWICQHTGSTKNPTTGDRCRVYCEIGQQWTI